jgi:hypothetical protein
MLRFLRTAPLLQLNIKHVSSWTAKRCFGSFSKQERTRRKGVTKVVLLMRISFSVLAGMVSRVVLKIVVVAKDSAT